MRWMWAMPRFIQWKIRRPPTAAAEATTTRCREWGWRMFRECLVRRICQFAFAVVGLCVMATTSDYCLLVNAFWFEYKMVSLFCLKLVLDLQLMMRNWGSIFDSFHIFFFVLFYLQALNSGNVAISWMSEPCLCSLWNMILEFLELNVGRLLDWLLHAMLFGLSFFFWSTRVEHMVV